MDVFFIRLVQHIPCASLAIGQMLLLVACATWMESADAPVSDLGPIERATASLKQPDHESLALITALLAQADSQTQVGIYGILPPGRPAFFDLIASGMRSSDPDVQAAAVACMSRLWPTSMELLTMVRERVSSPIPKVAIAAMDALSTIGDDRYLRPIMDRLLDEGDIAKHARSALLALSSTDAGLEPAAWEPVLEQRDQRTGPVLEKAKNDFAGTDVDAIRASIHNLLELNSSRSAVAETLAPLLQNQDPKISSLGRDALGNLGGGLAQVLLRGGSVAPPVQGAPIIVKQPMAADHTGVYAALAVVSLLGLVGFVLFRTPLKDTKMVRNATRSFTRRMLRDGQTRRLKKAQKAFEETGLYRKGAAAAKKVSETGMYQALVKKPAGEAVREATATFRRKRT